MFFSWFYSFFLSKLNYFVYKTKKIIIKFTVIVTKLLLFQTRIVYFLPQKALALPVLCVYVSVYFKSLRCNRIRGGTPPASSLTQAPESASGGTFLDEKKHDGTTQFLTTFERRRVFSGLFGGGSKKVRCVLKINFQTFSLHSQAHILIFFLYFATNNLAF